MNSSWLTIEPYVFIWQDSNFTLFYNSINYCKTIIKRSDFTDNVVIRLMDPTNYYCVSISEDFNDNELFQDFINTIQINNIGKYYQSTVIAKKSIFIPPNYIFPKKIETIIKNNIEYYDARILDNIQEVTIQLLGKCNNNCSFCDLLHKQICSCSKSDFILPLDSFKKISTQFSSLSIPKINIIGGNIALYPNLIEAIKFLKPVPSLKIYHIYNEFADRIFFNKIFKNDSNAIIKIVVDLNTAHYIKIRSLMKDAHKFIDKIIWTFYVYDDVALHYLNEFINESGIVNFEIFPIFNGFNNSFLEKHYFLNRQDISRIKLNMNGVFTNQVMNNGFFGKISIKADGQIFENENSASIGNVNENLEDIVYKIMLTGNSWLKIRNNEMCNDCIYRFICPPPSNIELLTKRNNICVKKLF